LVDDGGGLHGVEDLLHRVADGQHVAGGVLQPVTLAGVHEGRRIGQEAPVDHRLVERFGDLPHRRRTASVPRLAGRDGHGDAPAHLLGSLDDLPVFPREIPLTQDAQRGLGPLADLRRAGFGQHRLLLSSGLSTHYRGTSDSAYRRGPPGTSYILWCAGHYHAESSGRQGKMKFAGSGTIAKGYGRWIRVGVVDET